MSFDAELATIRFGLGLSPRHDVPRSVDALLEEARATPRHPITAFPDVRPTMADIRQGTRDRRAARGTDQEEMVVEKLREMRRAINEERDQALRIHFARAVDAPIGISERLTAFWADHFTVLPRNGASFHLISGYIEQAIRPHIMGRFEDMIVAAALHPMMLLFLDQSPSVGAGSVFGIKRKRGANENLARELLELHSLGVDGPYTQTDVSELADLLTGVSYVAEKGVRYDPRGAEPGAETVLGVTYSDHDSLENVQTALRDLARHPATAQHLSYKLAQYFTRDEPSPDLVSAMADTYLASDGNLGSVVARMLDHPDAWAGPPSKIKPPDHYVASGLRALGVQGIGIIRSNRRTTREVFHVPLRVMGQPWQRANGPDGWPEIGTDWVTPQAMAGRINWAMQVPRKMMKGRLSDPRDFVTEALGRFAGEDVLFAARAAESREEGIGIVLASPAFQRS